MTTSTALLARPGADPDELYEGFAEWAAERGLELYPAQSEALIELVSGSNVILSTPTGSGKSLVALGAHVAALSRGHRTVYTAPIKALVSEKFFALGLQLGYAQVGMLTGDAAVNPEAPVICCTAEVLANWALREGENAQVGSVIMDEFHFYADPERGWAWQVPLIELPQAQFLLMSATLGDVSFFAEDLTRRTGRETAVVAHTERPVPLSFRYARTPLHETITELLAGQQAPVYVVHTTQAAAVEQAQALMSLNVCSKAEKEQIAELIGAFRFTAGFGKTLSRLVRHGIGVHHAGMLPKYRRLVETLAQAGLLKLICGTDTLGVGINVPIRTVLFTALTKFDGQRVRHLRAREFHQVAGRAGRAGHDTAGYVVAQAPEHEMENAKRLAKAGDDVKKQRRVVRVKPPEGFVSWSEKTLERLVEAQPEPLTSQFRVSTAMLLQVAQRQQPFFAAMRHLLEDNHADRPTQRRLILRAIALYRGLLEADVVERVETDAGPDVRLVDDLQVDFALNQPLSPFALAAFELLDKESPTYALDLVSVVEATLDDPKQVLRAQENKARGEAVQAMKAEGIEYEERMELLEDVTWPKPLSELLSAAYESYRSGHPWVADHELAPKSVVRDLYERAMTFTEYVSYYGIARSEGLVLRYLTDAFRALRQTIPETARTEDLDDLVAWLGELVRQTDSSLLDEWENLAGAGGDDTALEAAGEDAAARATPGGDEHSPPPVTRNERAFRVLVRNEMFRRVELFARRSPADLAALSEDGPDAETWAAAMEEYFAEYPTVGAGPDARGPAFFRLTEDGRTWHVRQVLDDPEGDHDWAISADVDLDASDELGAAAVHVTAVGPMATA
ncbi:DEAD/DEAH box helicase [Actinomycetospora cinnamomea]|uniref:Helicase-like protein n=1 Tax=Actinomycetospora cinnamomea TaxID=663609 RepID=A0A2U1FPS1_9PSEU|nr:DEAD/DEAH box helicase [Actinomycetospora cinnamomea]PVZ14159.1 helicase-like protein [Actinomycetospora cinnamomea]